MNRALIAVLALLAFGMCVACNKGKDSVESNGTRVFGQRMLKDGTRTIERLEFADGTKKFGIIVHPDHTENEERVERPDREKQFDVTYLPDDTVKIGRTEEPNGEKWFDVTKNLDGEAHIARIEYRDGSERSDVTRLPDGTEQSSSQSSAPDESQEDAVQAAAPLTFEVFATETGVNQRVPGMSMYDQALYVAHGQMDIHGKILNATIACTVEIKTCRRLAEGSTYTWNTLPASDPRVYKRSVKGHVKPADSILISNGRATTVYYFVEATDRF